MAGAPPRAATRSRRATEAAPCCIAGKSRFLKRPRLNLLWRRWRAKQGDILGSYDRLPEFIRNHAPGKSFADIGCMWGVNGEYAFLAEEAGATAVRRSTCSARRRSSSRSAHARGSGVRFVLGDITRADTLDAIGQADVVFCAGVLYHHPSPFDLLVALRRICRETLILRTSTIPEVRGLPNAAVYFPMLDAKARELWNLKSLGLLHQAGHQQRVPAAGGLRQLVLGPDAELPRVAAEDGRLPRGFPRDRSVRADGGLHARSRRRSSTSCRIRCRPGGWPREISAAGIARPA